MTDRGGLLSRNFDFDELRGSLRFSRTGFSSPVQKTLVAELMLPAECSSSERRLIELYEPVLALLLGKSSRRHAEQDTSIEVLGEIISMGLLGPLHTSGKVRIMSE